MAVSYNITTPVVPELSQDQRDLLSELVHQHYRKVVSLAYRVVRDSDQAADIAQTVFLKMAINFWRYDSGRKFSTWIHRITVNAAIDHLRRTRSRAQESLDSCQEWITDARPSPDVIYRRRLFTRQLAVAARMLTTKQWSAFRMRDIEGHDIEEIAIKLRMPEATVRWYVHRARIRLKKELQASYPQLPGNYQFD